MNKNVLIIDDDHNIRLILKEILLDDDYSTFDARSWDKAHKILLQNTIDLVLLDVCLPNISGMEILSILKKDFAFIEVIVISGHGNIDLAVKAIKNGAFDFIEKPFTIDKILTVSDNALKLKHLKEENYYLKDKVIKKHIDFIGESKAIKEVNEKIDSAAKSNAWVFITGENGTGKEIVAKKIHFKSDRWNKPFVQINCAAIPEELIESELFGHEKGAFTGAISSKKGKFELADKGTLLLDEVADISINTQAKVLRALQERTIQRLGGTKNIKLDIRVISATNKYIHEEVKNGNFREDLYYRLHVIPINMPNLQERKEDIIPLMNHYLDYFAKQSKFKKKIINQEAGELLLKYRWPGNVRELKNTAERLNILIENTNITATDVKEHVINQNQIVENIKNLDKYTTLKEAKKAFEKEFISSKLKSNKMNISKTAKNLNIARSNLYKKMKKYNIHHIT